MKQTSESDSATVVVIENDVNYVSLKETIRFVGFVFAAFRHFEKDQASLKDKIS